MKLQCSCGAKYTFEVTPDMAQQPVHFVCSACGLDASEYVTQLVRQQFAAATRRPSLPRRPQLPRLLRRSLRPRPASLRHLGPRHNEVFLPLCQQSLLPQPNLLE